MCHFLQAGFHSSSPHVLRVSISKYLDTPFLATTNTVTRSRFWKLGLKLVSRAGRAAGHNSTRQRPTLPGGRRPLGGEALLSSFMGSHLLSVPKQAKHLPHATRRRHSPRPHVTEQRRRLQRTNFPKHGAKFCSGPTPHPQHPAGKTPGEEPLPPPSVAAGEGLQGYLRGKHSKSHPKGWGRQREPRGDEGPRLLLGGESTRPGSGPHVSEGGSAPLPGGCSPSAGCWKLT